MNKGFTLIEILIVMVIITIVGGITLLSITRNQNTRIESLAKQLSNALSLAEEQAMLQPVVLGLRLSKGKYQFYQWQEASNTQNALWLPLTDSTLGPKHFADDILIRINKADEHTTNNEENDQPQIIISTNGELTPFTLTLSNAKQAAHYRIVGAANGSITYESI